MRRELREGLPVPRPASLLAPDLDHDRLLELLLDDGDVDHPRLRRARRSIMSAGGDRARVHAREPRWPRWERFTAGLSSARIGVGPTIVSSAILFGPALILVPLAPKSFPDTRPRRVLRHRRGRGGALQHQRDQSHADAHARAPAGPAQRLTPLHRLGHDPAGRPRWRRARLRSSACTRRSGSAAIGACRLLRACRAVADPPHPRDADRVRAGPGRRSSAVAGTAGATADA